VTRINKGTDAEILFSEEIRNEIKARGQEKIPGLLLL